MKYYSIQVFKFLGIQVFEFSSIQVFECLNIWVFDFQEFEFWSILVYLIFELAGNIVPIFQNAGLFLPFPWLMAWFVYSIGYSPNLHPLQYSAFLSTICPSQDFVCAPIWEQNVIFSWRFEPIRDETLIWEKSTKRKRFDRDFFPEKSPDVLFHHFIEQTINTFSGRKKVKHKNKSRSQFEKYNSQP